MTFKRLVEISQPHFHCLTLDRYFPRSWRGFLRRSAALFALISFALSFDVLPLYLGAGDAFFFIFVFIFLILSFLEFFYRSMNGEGIQTRIREKLSGDSKIDYALSSVLYITDEIDVTRAFLEAKVGREIFLRCGVGPEELKHFIYSDKTMTIASSLNLEGEAIDLAVYATSLYDADKSLAAFLSQNSVNREEFVGAAGWVMVSTDRGRRRQRFWSRENLGAIPSIGTSWAYGVATDLGKYGLPFENTVALSSVSLENGYRDREVRALEGILERREEANAIIIDDDEAVVRDIVGRFWKKVKLGTSPPSLENRNLVELDWAALTAAYKERNELEGEILKILNQSLLAGNVILFIRDLAAFVSSVKPLGINLASLISSYLSSPNLPFITSATNTDFHYFIETNPALLEKFERIIPDPAGVEASMAALLEQIPSVERQYGFFFSYPAVLSLVKAADRFVSYGEMPGKALDMLTEIAPWTVTRKIWLVRESDVASFVSEKTGIATGGIQEKEAEKIERLEEMLHKRVVGQKEAVSGIANAIKRSRAGVGNPKKPLASFLFIGPTGVGKTEVSKALAESFFGDEKKMIRFDMSEYNGAEAASQLIGDFATGKSGLLASRVRDNPYSVLLLDEFEKAAPDVLDLFLQILDEGLFTDALGKQVSCRNLIIIATSNAGSSLIWETVKVGQDLATSKDLIVNSIIKEKVFRPELLNRFDGVILFHPLLNTELESIARLELQKLAKRLKEQDIEFVINDDVVNFLVEKGSDPEFGGRSVNRAIQDIIENLIADKIVRGDAKPGSKIEIKAEELANQK